MQKVIVLVFGLVAISTLKAQERKIVRGKVYDSNQVTLTGATVEFLGNLPKDTFNTVTDQSGQFIFNRIRSSSFTIRVTNIGMELFEQQFHFEAGKQELNIGTIALKPDSYMLQEVVITPPEITIKEDTIEFRADSFQVRPNSSVEDLLKRIPGIQIERDGSITAQGKTVGKVRVNGKDFFGNDPTTATRELPAEIIDRIQIVDDYGDMAAISGIRDGDPDIIINLQLKKDKSQGVFGKGAVGYGTDDRYQATANLNIFRNRTQISVLGNLNNINQNLFNFSGGGGAGGGGNRNRGGAGMAAGASTEGTSDSNAGQNGITKNNSIGLNFRTDFDKGSFFGNYSFANRNTDIFSSTSRQNFFDDNFFINNQNSIANNIVSNHRANFNLEYNIDSFNYVRVNPNFTYSGNRNRSTSDFDFREGDDLLTKDGYNGDSLHANSPSFSVDIHYNHKFKSKRGRNFLATLNLGGSTLERENNKDNLTRQYLLGIISEEVYLNQMILQDNNNHNYGFKVTYTEPIKNNRFVDVTYGYNTAYSKIDRSTYDVDDAFNLSLVEDLSNAYENRFNNQNAGVSIRTVRQKYNYTIGVTMQPMQISGYSFTKDSSYTAQRRINFAPSARMSYNFSRTKRINFSYNANYNQPGFNQLQPVREVSNLQYQTEGNPDLRPEFRHNFRGIFNNFNAVSGRTLVVGLNGNVILNRIVNNNIRLDNTGAQLSRPENINGYYAMGAFYNIGLPFQNKKYTLRYRGNVNYTHDVGLVDYQKNIGNNWVGIQSLMGELRLKQWLEFGVGGSYTINSTHYTLTRNGERLNNTTWAASSNMRVDVPGGWILRYDVNYFTNTSLADNVSASPTLFNASIEKTLLKRKNAFIRLSGFDIFNQNTNISRNVTGNAIIDSRVNRLTRYFMLTFTYRLLQFKGAGGGQEERKSLEMDNRGPRPDRGEGRNRPGF